jgi:hypothetical protein
MKKALLFIAFGFLYVLSATAQKPVPPPPAVPDYFPDAWKEYSYPNDNIRFRFPDEPKITKTASYTSYERESFIKFHLTISPSGVNIVGTDKARQQTLLTVFSMVFESGAESSGTKIIKQEDTTIDGYPAKFLQFETKDGILTRAKIFVIKDKVYAAETDVKTGERHGVNWENDFEKPVMAFLDSLHLISN